MLHYVEIFYRDEKPNYGRLHCKKIDKVMFKLLKDIEYKLCGLEPEIFSGDSPLNYNGAELDLCYYLLGKYNILSKVTWIKSFYEKNKMYIMTNIVSDELLKLKKSDNFSKIQTFLENYCLQNP